MPVPGRDIFVQAWYQGGLSVIDFTDSTKPTEIAYFDRGPISDKAEVLGGYWSTYWYRGRIYGTEIARGLDVLELSPSQHLTASEIAAANWRIRAAPSTRSSSIRSVGPMRPSWPAPISTSWSVAGRLHRGSHREPEAEL